ncbi:MAG: LysR substrate-binding domain-containing protein [Alphaproteobacteria bacterium]
MERIEPILGLGMRLRVKHFMLLAALGDSGRILRAAEVLNMTQPAATRLLQEIENAFDTKLFDRSRRGVVPTDAGSALIMRAKIILHDLTAAKEELSLLSSHPGGIVSVGAFAVATPVLLPLALIEVRSRYQDILVTVQEGSNDSLLPALSRGEIDCVIGRMTETIPDTLTWQTLYFEPVRVVCGPQNRLLDNPSVSISDVAGHSWIMPHRAHPFRQQLEARFTVSGKAKPQVILESESLFLNASLLRQTDALALMPLTAAEHLASLGSIGLLSLEFGTTEAPVGVFKRRGVEETRPLSYFMEALGNAAREVYGTYNVKNYRDV